MHLIDLDRHVAHHRQTGAVQHSQRLQIAHSLEIVLEVIVLPR